MQITLKIYTLFALCLFMVCLKAQDTRVKNKKLVQFSGIVVTRDSLNPVPYVNIVIKGTKRGTISDYNGFFSFVSEEGDIIDFSALGYRTVTFRIPDSLSLSRYSWIQVMTTDTIYLSETIIVPWPTLEQFKKAFVMVKIPNDDMQRAQKNLNLAEMKERCMNYPMDGSMNYRNFVDQQVYKSYYNGQYMPNNLLNPFAWAQFVKAWKEGKFKKQNED
jgi:hypothetical protein